MPKITETRKRLMGRAHSFDVFIEEYNNYSELEEKAPPFARKGLAGILYTEKEKPWFILVDEETSNLILVYHKLILSSN